MEELYNLALADNGKGVIFTEPSLIHGRGLFSSQCLPRNTILCRRLGLREGLSNRDKRAIIGVDGLDPAIPEDFIFKFINHSCQPNAYLSDTGCLVSLKTIAEQDEITIDYANILTGSDWQTPCFCGLPTCRHLIRSI